MTLDEIIEKLPYSDPFLFVTELREVTEVKSIGTYTFKKDEYFYQGHFAGNPVTPGVILTEVMAQIGVVCLGIYLLRNSRNSFPQIAMTSTKIDFFLPVLPGQSVRVESEKIYFRFNKLKCSVVMLDQAGEIIARGEISGMLK